MLARGSDFHSAMVATAPGEKLLITRRPVRKWNRRTISSLFLCRKLHLFSGKSTKTPATRAALFEYAPNRLSAGALPLTSLGSLQSSPRPLAVFRGPTSKGRRWKTREGGKGERREEKGKGGEAADYALAPLLRFLLIFCTTCSYSCATVDRISSFRLAQRVARSVCVSRAFS